MSASNCDYDSTNIPASCQPCRRTAAVRSFDFDAEFRRRYKLQCDDDKDGEDCDCSVSPEHSEYSDDYTSMTGSGASTTTLPPELLADRLETLSVSSGDSYYLYDTDDDDRCSISTLENVDESTTDSPVLAPAGSSVDVEEDSEFNLRARSTKTTAAVCRSTSLKSTYASRAPTSPRTKKVVRFADALGLDLESIRHILDFGDVPPAASDFSGHLAGSKAGGGGGGARMRLMVRFAEPGSSVNFLRRVQERKVSLEEVSVDGERLTVSGVIRVANVAYHKQVTVRYSVDNWVTYRDHAAVYLAPGGASTRYDGGLTDAFTFQLQLPHADAVLGARLEFSLRFVVGPDLTFWDSNFGANYAVDCLPIDVN